MYCRISYLSRLNMTSMAARLALRRTAQSCLQTNIAEASTSSLIRNFASSSRCPAASPSKDPKRESPQNDCFDGYYLLVLTWNSFAFSPPCSAVETPSQFMSAIAKPRRGELSSIIGLLGEDASWESLNKLSRIEMKKAGVNVKERR